MTTFWILASLMMLASLAFLLPRLWRGRQSGHRELGFSAAQARKHLKSLQQAHKDGHLSDADFEKRRAEISAVLLDDLHQGEEQDDPTRLSPATAIVLLILAPVFAYAVYTHVGDPVAIRAAEEGWLEMVSGDTAPHGTSGAGGAGGAGAIAEQGQAPDLNAAISGLQARLESNPEDLEGWFLLGRSHMAVQQFDAARSAFARAYALSPEDPVVMVEYAEALAFASGQPQLPQQASELLQKAVQLNPESQKGLWMLGLDSFQKGDFHNALDLWQELMDQLEPGSEIAASLAAQMDRARAEVGIPLPPGQPTASAPAPEPSPAPVAPTQSDTTANAAASAMASANAQTGAPANEPTDESAVSAAPEASGKILTIEVSLADALMDKVNPADTVYVFARAAAGPPMPLAIQRLAAGQLPITIRLDESMAMTPAMSIATFPELVVGARISKTGDAAPRPGDLQALSDPVANDRTDVIRLQIDTVL